MVSTFGGINTGASALHAARMNLEIAGHNIANMNDKNYSRQVLSTHSSHIGANGIWSGQHSQGDGVRINSLNRVADQFLIDQHNGELAGQGSKRAQLDAIHSFEKLYGEPSDTALAATLEQFWDSWDSLAATPDDPAARSAVVQRGNALTSTIQNVATKLDDEARNTEQTIDADVSRANSLIKSIADVNKLVVAGSLNQSLPPNDLLDRRDAFVRELSSITKTTVSFSDTNEMYVNINGAGVVGGGGTYNLLRAEVKMPTNVDERIGVKLFLGNSQQEIIPGEGSLRASMDVVNKEIPKEQDKINAVAYALYDQVNKLHNKGQDINGDKGLDFFIYPGGKVTTSVVDGKTVYTNDDTNKPITSLALMMKVNDDIQATPGKIAAAETTEGNLGNGISRAIAELARASGGADEIYRDQQTDLGVRARSKEMEVNQQDLTVKQANDNRMSISGVNQDEEVIKINQYIQAYQASARYLSAVDQMMDTLINGTGRVGR